MRTDVLSVALVEEIHRAMLRGGDMAGVVSGLEGATLPGLLEYGCLRWSCRYDGTMPDLPRAVTSSDLGRALGLVRSELGLSMNAPQRSPSRHLDPLSAEFFTVQGAHDLVREEWDYFATRFDASARHVGFSFDAAAKLQLALFEMAENAVIHAEAPAILVGYHASPPTALFCVADVGIGVLASLRKNPSFGRLTRHNEAIRTALQEGTTSLLAEEGGGGFGFRQVFTSLTDHWGSLRFRSLGGCITMEGTDCDANRGAFTHPPILPGFQVTVCCRTHAPASSQEQNDLFV